MCPSGLGGDSGPGLPYECGTERGRWGRVSAAVAFKGSPPSACYPWRSTSYALHRAGGRWQPSASVASRLTCCLRTCCRKPARSEASAAVCQCQVVSSTLSRDLWHKVDASHAHNTPTVGSRPYTGFRKVVIGLGTARLLVVACCCYNLEASLESDHYK